MPDEPLLFRAPAAPPSGEITITVTSLPADQPLPIRLRRWIKTGLRRFRFKVRSVTGLAEGFDPYDGVPTSGDSDTSAAAAKSITPRRAELQRVVLRFLEMAGREGLTAEEGGALLADMRGDPDRFAYSPRSTFAARVTELTYAGKVKDSGKRRQNKSGSFATVWVAVDLPTASQPADFGSVM